MREELLKGLNEEQIAKVKANLENSALRWPYNAAN